MCDLIDRQAVIDIAKDWYDGLIWGSFRGLERRLRAIPSVQPEVIRCKDCKHWDKTWTNDWSPDYHYCPVMDEVRKGNLYCRYAERRTDE